MTTGETSRDSDIPTAATAIIRHVLPAAPILRLEITRDHNGVWLHLTYLAHSPGSASP